MSAYQELQDHFRRINHLNHIQQIVVWDEAAMMPVGGGQVRGEAMAALNVVAGDQCSQRPGRGAKPGGSKV